MYIPDTPLQYDLSFNSLARLFEFEEFVDLYLVFNSSARAPFHNYQAAQWAVEATLRYYHSIVQGHFNPQDVRTLLIATLFKDVNHGAGRCGDETNITNALLTLQEVNNMAKVPLTVPERKLASSLISSTLFVPDPLNPRFPSVVSTDMEKAMRDADLSIAFHIFTARGEDQILGFLEETNLALNLSGGKPLTLMEMIKLITDFLLSARFMTPLGCRIRDRHLKKCLDRLEAFGRAFTSNGTL